MLSSKFSHQAKTSSTLALGHHQVLGLHDKDRERGHAVHQHGLKSDGQTTVGDGRHPLNSDQLWLHVLEWSCMQMRIQVRLNLSNGPTTDFYRQDKEDVRKQTESNMIFPLRMFSETQQPWSKQVCHEVETWPPNFDWIPRPLSNGQEFFLILLSGHRRAGNIASWFHWNTDIQPLCVDMAIHETFGNVMNLGHWPSGEVTANCWRT